MKRFVIQMEAKRSTRDIFPDIDSSHLVHGLFLPRRVRAAEAADSK